MSHQKPLQQSAVGSIDGRRGFTLFEMLMVLGVIGVLVALLLPAIQASRENARRAQCGNNLRQLISAVHHYQHAHRVYPAGVVDPKRPIRNWPAGYHHSWMARILPFMEKRNTWRYLDFAVGAYHRKNKAVAMRSMTVHNCPSSWVMAGSASNYAGVHHDLEAPIDVDNHGVFFLNSTLRRKDISDGVSQTLFLGEKRTDGVDLGWLSGTRATLRNTGRPINSGTPGVPKGSLTTLLEIETGTFRPDDQPIVDEYGRMESILPKTTGQAPAPAGRGTFIVGPFGSYHYSGAQFAFGDGRVVFLGETIDLGAYQQMGHRADGKLLDLSGTQL